MTSLNVGFTRRLPQITLPVFDLEGKVRVADLALSNTIAETVALTEGVYEVYCASACFVSVEVSNAATTTTTGYPLLAAEKKLLAVREGSKIGGILASSTATLLISKIQ